MLNFVGLFLIVFLGDSMLKCRICGKETTQINYAHLKMHGLTSEQYKAMFPGEKLREISEACKDKLRENNRKKNSDPEFRKKVSTSMKGRNFSEEHKEALREAKANEDKEHRRKINGDNRRGAKHTPEMLLHIAKTSNQKHPFRGKSGIREDLGHFVRSTWEANFARILKYLGIAYEFEPETFFLTTHDGNLVTYTPDFRVGKAYVEVKGYWLFDAAEKFELFKQQHPEVKIHLVDKAKYEKYKERYQEKVTWEW